LHIAKSMNTHSAKAEAQRRPGYLHDFGAHLMSENGEQRDDT
ncbi:regulator, partial [Pseudoalteromonas sp. S1610]